MKKVSSLVLSSMLMFLTGCITENSGSSLGTMPKTKFPSSKKNNSSNTTEEYKIDEATLKLSTYITNAMETNLRKVSEKVNDNSSEIDISEYDTVVSAYLGEIAKTSSDLTSSTRRFSKNNGNSNNNSGNSSSNGKKTPLDDTFAEKELKAEGLPENLKKYYLAQIYGIFLKLSMDENAETAKLNQEKIINALAKASSTTTENAEKFLVDAISTAVMIFMPDQAKDILYEDENGMKVKKDFTLSSISEAVSQNSRVFDLERAIDKLSLKHVEEKSFTYNNTNFSVEGATYGLKSNSLEWGFLENGNWNGNVKFTDDGEKFIYSFEGRSADEVEVKGEDIIFYISDLKIFNDNNKYLEGSQEHNVFVYSAGYVIKSDKGLSYYKDKSWKDVDYFKNILDEDKDNPDYIDLIENDNSPEIGKEYNIGGLKIQYQNNIVENDVLSDIKLVLNNPSQTGLSYAKFGYITTDTNVPNANVVDFFYGSNNENIREYQLSSIDKETVFAGNAVGVVKYNKEGAEEKTLNLDGTVNLTIDIADNIKESLVVNFDNWYKVTAEYTDYNNELNIDFNKDGKNIDSTFDFDTYNHDVNEKIKAQHYNQNFSKKYFGVDNVEEVAGAVTGFYSGCKENETNPTTLNYGFSFGAKKQ